MKSERRHELEKNALADWLGDFIEKVKPYQNAILALVILVAATIGAYTLWSRQSEARTEADWDEFHAAWSSTRLNLSAFDRIAEQHPNTHLGLWAATIAADLHLNIGCNLLFADKAGANQELRQAVDLYVAVRQHSRHPMLLERATYGLARAWEAQGDLQQAIERYEDVARTWPDGAYATEAARRTEDLKRPATKEWYDRFAKFDPKPAYADEPGTPGKRPAFDVGSPPEEGPLFVPKIKLDEKGEDDKPLDKPDDKPADKPDDEPADVKQSPDKTDK